MKKLNWSCSACGLCSSRRYSVERHIRNYHKSDFSFLIPYVSYVAGIKAGLYNPELDKQIYPKQLDLVRFAEEEYCRTMIAEFVKKHIEISTPKAQTPEAIFDAASKSKAFLLTFTSYVKGVIATARKLEALNDDT